jgi:hypothetical protein
MKTVTKIARRNLRGGILTAAIAITLDRSKIPIVE